MFNILIILATLIVSPSFCHNPCTIHYTLKLDYPALRGELCVHLSLSNYDDDEHTKSCKDVDDKSRRFIQNDFKNVEDGIYLIYVTINDKLVSEKRTVQVIGEGKFR